MVSVDSDEDFLHPKVKREGVVLVVRNWMKFVYAFLCFMFEFQFTNRAQLQGKILKRQYELMTSSQKMLFHFETSVISTTLRGLPVYSFAPVPLRNDSLFKLQFLHPIVPCLPSMQLPGCWHQKNPMDAIFGDDHYSCLDFGRFFLLKKTISVRILWTNSAKTKGWNAKMKVWKMMFFFEGGFQVRW